MTLKRFENYASPYPINATAEKMYNMKGGIYENKDRGARARGLGDVVDKRDS